MIRHLQTFRHSQTLISLFGIRGSMLGTVARALKNLSGPLPLWGVKHPEVAVYLVLITNHSPSAFR